MAGPEVRSSGYLLDYVGVGSMLMEYVMREVRTFTHCQEFKFGFCSLSDARIGVS